MTRVSITAAAFDAIAAKLPLGSVAYEAEVNDNGERLIWLETRWVNQLAAMRGKGESFSDVILRIVAADDGGNHVITRKPKLEAALRNEVNL